MMFEFVFYNMGADGWRIYIITDIDYKGKDAFSHDAHWLKDREDTYRYICWDGKIDTYEQAKAVASLWADCTYLYINDRFNRTFDMIALTLKLQRGL